MKCTAVWIDSGCHYGTQLAAVGDSFGWFNTYPPHVFTSERAAIRACVAMKKAGKKMPAKIGLRAADIRIVELRDDEPDTAPPFGPDHPVTISPDMVES